MKNAMDAEQSSNRMLEITPFIPLILRGEEANNLYFKDPPLKTCPERGRRIRGA
jgi:hypothetical protein